MATKQIKDHLIYLSHVLGRGTYGSVYLGKKDKTGEKVAIKILNKQNINSDEYLKAALLNEIAILQIVRSENIVGFFDVMESSKNYYIIQELCDGDISAIIKPGKQIPEEECIEMLRQLCNGFLALVKEGIIHRDLKPANIMKKGNILKLGDFGFAKRIELKKMMHTAVGTPLYMPLEVLKGEEYTSKCDIWALGFIFYELLHGKTPWIASSEVQLAKNIEHTPLKIQRKDLCPQTVDFLTKTLKVREADRISWDQIFVHPIFKGFFLDKANQQKEFENKLKTIMNKLRLYVNANNLDLNKILDEMGYTSSKNEIGFSEFYDFLKRVYDEMTQKQAKYVFLCTDTDESGTISISEIESLLNKHRISFESQLSTIPNFQKNNEETFVKISKDTSRKISNCFKKLYRSLTKTKTSLYTVFLQFDHKKGKHIKDHCLTLQDFSKLMKKLSSQTDLNNVIQDDEIEAAFQLIDEDGSSTIQYEELSKYYCKINGIHETPIASETKSTVSVINDAKQKETQKAKSPRNDKAERHMKQEAQKPDRHRRSEEYGIKLGEYGVKTQKIVRPEILKRQRGSCNDLQGREGIEKNSQFAEEFSKLGLETKPLNEEIPSVIQRKPSSRAQERRMASPKSPRNQQQKISLSPRGNHIPSPVNPQSPRGWQDQGWQGQWQGNESQTLGLSNQSYNFFMPNNPPNAAYFDNYQVNPQNQYNYPNYPPGYMQNQPYNQQPIQSNVREAPVNIIEILKNGLREHF